MNSRNIINYVPPFVLEFFKQKKQEMKGGGVNTIWEVVAFYLEKDDKFREDFKRFMNYRGIKGNIDSVIYERGEVESKSSRTTS